jgi:radical SAM superfamily enzyme YgiQ (UPF0313 family)
MIVPDAFAVNAHALDGHEDFLANFGFIPRLKWFFAHVLRRLFVVFTYFTMYNTAIKSFVGRKLKMNVVVATLNAKYIHTSLALRYLKAYCEPTHQVEMAEYTIKDPVMNIVTDLFQRKPQVVGFSCYIWNIEETLVVVSMLKKVLPDVTVVLGGPEVSYDTLDWLKRAPDVDFIVVGEGEETFLHLLNELESTRKFHLVFGIGYRDARTGVHVINPTRPKLDLNAAPSPYRFPEDVPSLANRIVYFETSRGCPFSCQFCLSSIEVGVRYYDIERTKRDLLYLIANGAKLIKFVDRTFNIKRDYALEMFQFLIDNHGGCVFQFEITADIMRPEVLEFLNEHAPKGIFRFEIGVQSTNEMTNAIVQRKQNFAKLTRTVNLVKAGGKIDQHLDLIAGLPMEDYGSFRNTFNDVFALGPEELQLGFLKMLRGTGLRRDADKYGYKYMDDAPYEMLSNEVLPFEDVVRIKRVEDVLEKYWNAHRMDRTLGYVIRSGFESAFDFFQAFGDFWESQGWQRIGHQLEDLFVRLHEFLLAAGVADMDVIEGLMKVDYFEQHRYKPRKLWWAARMSEAERGEAYRGLLEQPDVVAGLSERDLYKHTVLERLPFDLALYTQSGNIDRTRSTLLVVSYATDGDGPSFYMV